MHLPISKRLLACCSFIAPGDRVADIGCDHGYLGIHLLQNGIAASVIAADVNRQPLDSAYVNAHKYGVQNKMSFYLSDGAVDIPRDFDTMVCAGMGADTMISILAAAPWLQDSKYRLVLQCQSKIPMLRSFLSRQGWQINRETALQDGRFLYTVMEVLWQPGSPVLTPGQCYCSPALLKNPDPIAREYYYQMLLRLNRAVSAQKEAADPFMVTAQAELQALIDKTEFQWLKEESQ